jgi:putative ABC transport system permease protein
MTAGHATLRDLRFALLSLRRTPGFTLIAIVTLGLGIGANTSMFSILNGYMLRPAPYPDSDRLERIYRATPQNPRGGISPADYLDLKSEMKQYGEIAGYAYSDMSLSEPGSAPQVAVGLRASANLFSTLGSRPQLGRGFRPEEEAAGNHRVVVISHRLWQNRFAGDPHVIGRTVRVDGEPHDVVGVLPADFSDWRHLSDVDVFRPLGLDDKEIRDRTSASLRLVGLRSPGVSHARAEAFVAGFGRRLAARFPAANAESSWRSVPIDETFLPGNGRVMITMLIFLSAFVLLIACSNLANLLLARTMARAREFAVRSALGASRPQVLRSLLAEALVLAVAGGACALYVARWTFDWFHVHSANDNGDGIVLTMDWRILAWAFGASVFTAVAFGVAPALFVLRLDLNSTLKSGARGMTGDRGHRRFRSVLIVGQFALAMVLLAGAALFARGLDELNHRRSGWDSDPLVTGTLALPPARYPGEAEITGFQRRALQRLEALPGVASASISYSMPFFGAGEPHKFVVAGRQAPRPGREPSAGVNGVTAHYFQTVGTRLLEGRAFTERDNLASPRVFVVNQSMARGLFGRESAIGKRIAQTAADGPVEWGEIVGVVADVRSVAEDPNPVTYQLYQPMEQAARGTGEIAVRAAGVAPSTLVASIRATITSVDPDLPVRNLRPAEVAIARVNYQLGVLSSVLTALALLGLGLASLGLFGIITRTTAQRTGEFGIRMALGAQAGDITRLVLNSGARLALLGSALGLVGAFGVTRLISSAFPGMQFSSVPVMGGATVLLSAIALVACYLPARHASKLSPLETLRAQ